MKNKEIEMRLLTLLLPISSLVACSPGFVPLNPGVVVETNQAKLVCPDLSGDWLCSEKTQDAKGKTAPESRVWTESVKTAGDRYTIIYDQGTKSETTSEFVADGKPMSEAHSVKGAAVSFYKKIAADVGPRLPDIAQIKLAAHISSLEETTETNIAATGVATCDDGVLKADVKFDAKFGMPFVVSVEGTGVAKTEQKIVNEKRVTIVKIAGTGTGKSEIPAVKMEPLVISLESIQTTVCEKKKK